MAPQKTRLPSTCEVSSLGRVVVDVTKGRFRAEIVPVAWAWNPTTNVFIRKERKVQRHGKKACEDGGRKQRLECEHLAPPSEEGVCSGSFPGSQ